MTRRPTLPELITLRLAREQDIWAAVIDFRLASIQISRKRMFRSGYPVTLPCLSIQARILTIIRECLITTFLICLRHGKDLPSTRSELSHGQIVRQVVQLTRRHKQTNRHQHLTRSQLVQEAERIYQGAHG